KQLSADFTECFLQSEYATCIKDASEDDPTAYMQKMLKIPSVGNIKMRFEKNETAADTYDLVVESISYAFIVPDYKCVLFVEFWLERRKPDGSGYYPSTKLFQLTQSLNANDYANGSLSGSHTYQPMSGDWMYVYAYIAGVGADSGAVKWSYRLSQAGGVLSWIEI
ncbi:MAG: hypothetical protein IJB97_08790, partial [Clostridia bacterium]|nr:hypothetical protein [Clostridia bacterium]